MKRLRKLSEVPALIVKQMAAKSKKKKQPVVEEEDSSESTHVDKHLYDATVDEDYTEKAAQEKEDEPQ